MRDDLLRSVLASESRAYGFTLAFWGSGALLVGNFGLPALPQIILYTGGALLGFSVMIIWAFREAFTTVDTEEPDFLVFSMIHYMSALLPILVTWMLLNLEGMRILGVEGMNIAFLISGFGISTLYNIFIPVEDYLSEKALEWEKRLVGL